MAQLLMVSVQDDRKPRKPTLEGAAVPFEAVFGQSLAARVKILEILAGSAIPMRHKDILDQIRAVGGSEVLSSQGLEYHLKEMKTAGVIDQNSAQRYSITETGHFLFTTYSQLEENIRRDSPKPKPGFVSELSASIKHGKFDCNLLAEELSLSGFFIKLPSIRDCSSFRWKDPDRDFESEIEINQDGTMYAKVIIYQRTIQVEGSFSEDMEKTNEWYEAARALTRTIYFYVKRSAQRIWSDAEVDLTFEDAYGINLYSEAK
ncbi:MAG: hypothetical protein M1587_10395 [Thaumarchaeota archaeon]|nr:hypothetical protein [Nitrososphaerota archaeon]